MSNKTSGSETQLADTVGYWVDGVVED